MKLALVQDDVPDGNQHSGLTETPPPLERNKRRNQRKRTFKARKGADYIALNASANEIGLAGEVLVLEHEKTQLRHSNREDLAQRVRHVSIEVGDGPGYDVLSFDSEVLSELSAHDEIQST